MLSRGSVLSSLDHQVIQQDECPAADKHTMSVCTKGGKSLYLKGSERNRSKRSSLSRFVNFISGSVKDQKKWECASNFDCSQPDLYFGGVHLEDENSTKSCVNLSILKRSRDKSRRRSGNGVVFGRDSSRTVEMDISAVDMNISAVDMNISADLLDRLDFMYAGNCASPYKHRRGSSPAGCISDDGLEDRTQHSFTMDTTGDLSQNEETNRSRFYKKSLSRGRLTSLRKFGALPRSLRSPFAHKKANASPKHLHNQTLDSYAPGQRQLNLSSKQSSNKTVDSSIHVDKRTSGPRQHLNQTVESSNCHKQTSNSAKPVAEDRSMAGTELKAADCVHNTGTASRNQDHVNQTDRVASWAVHFDQLLKDPLGINIFTKFLEKEFSDENMRFWQVCQEFRGLTDQHQQQALAKDIYHRHIAMRASDPVNVDNAVRSHTEQFLDSPTTAMFDVAQSQIQRLMKLDSYPRFLKSDLYKNVLVDDMEGKVLGEPEKAHKMKEDKKQNAGKENKGKRRRSLLPWMRFL